MLAVGIPAMAGLVGLSRFRGPSGPTDALQQAVLAELDQFTRWLAANDGWGYIGEVGWPDNTDGDALAWNALANTWFDAADRAKLWVTTWATGEWWSPEYKLAAYVRRGGGPGVDTPNTQARVLEAHPSTTAYLRGINVAGGSFSSPTDEPTSSFSNANPGTYDVHYHYEDQATFNFLARRGLLLARVDFRWERLQPALKQPLDPVELARLDEVVRRAGAARLRIVLDMHNYGAYYLSDGKQGVRRAIGTPEVGPDCLADVWQRLSDHFRDEPRVIAYGLMNEPADLPRLFEASTTHETWDGPRQPWVADNDGREVLGFTTSPVRSGSQALRVAKVFPATPGYGHLRIHDNGGSLRGRSDLSNSGDTLAVWVYVPADAPGTQWEARLFVYTELRAFDALASTDLIRGGWTRVTGRFSPSALTEVRAVGLQVYANDVAGPAWVVVDELSQGSERSPAQVWESASQAAVDAIRANKDEKLVMVSGYGWSRVQDWAERHPVGWIRDAANRVRYEAHHYWDRGQSSFYREPYEVEVVAAERG
jgi:hypothetical protein